MILPSFIEDKFARKWASRKDVRDRAILMRNTVSHGLDQETVQDFKAFAEWTMKTLVGICLAISLFGASPAGAAELPAGYSCQDLRAKVSEYGTVVLISMAKTRGFSDGDISAFRKKCRV